MSNNKKTSSAAVKEVLGLPELLHQLMEHLSERELLVNSRVSTTWRDSAQSSLSMRQRLFLAAAPPTKGWIVSDNFAYPDPAWEMGPDPVLSEEMDPPLARHLAPRGYIQETILNPLLFKRSATGDWWTTPEFRAWHGERVVFRRTSDRHFHQQSCNQMFITQPPTYTLNINGADVNFPHPLRYVDVLRHMHHEIVDADTHGEELHVVLPGVLLTNPVNEDPFAVDPGNAAEGEIQTGVVVPHGGQGTAAVATAAGNAQTGNVAGA